MTRNLTVDYMRVLGIMLIMLAHVSPPLIIFQIRTFDVPMMCFISGLAFYCSGKLVVDFKGYAIKRFKRLVFPVWSFQIIFFLSIYIFNIKIFQPLFTKDIILSSIALNGFGYFWIIRIFLMVALLSPLISYISLKIKDNQLHYFSAITVILSTVLAKVNLDHTLLINKIINHSISDIIVPCMSYGTLFLLGIRWINLSNSNKMKCVLTFGTLCVTFFIFNYLINSSLSKPQDYKYPPTLFYIAYSVPMIGFFYYIFDTKIKNKKTMPALLSFISKNTIWIYLWHIPVVSYFYALPENIWFVFKYAAAVSIALCLTKIQSVVYGYACHALRNHASLKKLISECFTG